MDIRIALAALLLLLLAACDPGKVSTLVVIDTGECHFDVGNANHNRVEHEDGRVTCYITVTPKGI